ncbi:magnesium transporter NIPA-domain-containing protein [Obelidium mucronatum]|nr:magnesium transporter NIPA-domain-containing protein [Obelidium mucronatum]
MSNTSLESHLSQTPPWQSAVGITLALVSNAFIGASVVFRKRGLLDVAARGFDVTTGSTAYLRNGFWWAGMLLLAIGELSNFGAYAFSPAILVTPLGTLSVVISIVLSNYVLHEKLNFLGKTGCGLCILGVIMIVTHAPTAQVTDTIPGFIMNAVHPVFLIYSFLIGCFLVWLVYYAEPRWAKQTPMVYIGMSSCGGSYLVLSAQGVGSSIVTSAREWSTNNQFLRWEMYPLIIFMILTIVFQIHYLNKALAVYSTAIVYPIHYVCFTGVTMLSTAFLFREFPVTSIDAGGSIVEGFIVLATGVVLLYKSNFEEGFATDSRRSPDPSSTTNQDTLADYDQNRFSKYEHSFSFEDAGFLVASSQDTISSRRKNFYDGTSSGDGFGGGRDETLAELGATSNVRLQQ